MIIAQFSVSCQYHEAIYQDIYADIYQDMETTIQQPNLLEPSCLIFPFSLREAMRQSTSPAV